MAATLLPGSRVPQNAFPKTSSNKPLALGPGLRPVERSHVQVTTSGPVASDARKNTIWIDGSGGRYLPSIGDLVVATVHHSSAEQFNCQITPYTPFAILGQLSFEGATKKTRPNLAAGALVYARVSRIESSSDIELECVNPATGKSDGMGPLKDGMVFDISPELARRIMIGVKKGGVVALEEIGAKAHFEVAVGRNGRAWVDGGSVKSTLAIGRILKEIDEKCLDMEEQKRLVKQILRDV